MSAKPNGAGVGHCDVCERRYSWGCGHSGSQEYDARKHNGTKAHAERRCLCYGHDHCDPKTCKLAGKRVQCYVPFHQHTEKPMKTFTVRDEHGNVVAGLENVVEDNALLRMLAYTRALSSLAVEETSYATHGYSKTKERYFVTRTA